MLKAGAASNASGSSTIDPASYKMAKNVSKKEV
jgi:hypothetical protein